MHLGPWTPAVSFFAALGFFGLDQVAIQLEDPFGVDDNDFPLLLMGLGLCDDLDAILKSNGRRSMEARQLTAREKAEIRKVAKAVLGWGADEKTVEETGEEERHDAVSEWTYDRS